MCSCQVVVVAVGGRSCQWPRPLRTSTCCSQCSVVINNSYNNNDLWISGDGHTDKVLHTDTTSYISEILEPCIPARALRSLYFPSVCTFLAIRVLYFPLIQYCSTNDVKLSPFLHSFIANPGFMPKSISKPICFNNPWRLTQRLWFIYTWMITALYKCLLTYLLTYNSCPFCS